MRRAATLALLLAVPAVAAAQTGDPGRPRTAPAVVFDGIFGYWGSLCDCDMSDMVLLTRMPIAAHAQPKRSSPVVRTVEANRLIEGNDWDIDFTAITAARRVTLRAPLRVTGGIRMTDPMLGNWGDSPRAAPFTVPAGTRVTVLDAYADEGFARFGTTTYYGTVPNEEGTGRHASTYWWRLTATDGKPAAWIEIDWRNSRRFEMLCETHSGCVAGFTPTFRPNRR